MTDGYKRHTPVLSGETVIRALSCDSALLPFIGEQLSLLSNAESWLEVGDSVDSIVSEVYATIERYYGGFMVGAVQFFLTSVPLGWLECNGQTVQQSDYPELAQVLDASLKNDIAGTMIIPDLRDLVILGSGLAYSFGATGGATTHTLVTSEIPSHSHQYIPPLVDIDLITAGAPDVTAARLGSPTQTGLAGGDGAHNNMQPYYALTVATFAGKS